MKKVLLVLALTSLISCVNNIPETKNVDSTINVDSLSLDSLSLDTTKVLPTDSLTK